MKALLETKVGFMLAARASTKFSCKNLGRCLALNSWGNLRQSSEAAMNNREIIRQLEILKSIYHVERCYNFDSGINSIINILNSTSDQSGEPREQAASIYRTLAVSKSGFSDVYVNAGTADERVAANIKLDGIRQLLWDTFRRV